MLSQAKLVKCAVCGETAERPLNGGLSGVAGLEELPVCSGKCQARSVRFAGRHLANRQTSIAGHGVALLGVVAGALFLAAERDMGGLLLVFSVFSLGTVRLAYPDVVPPGLVKRWGADRVIEAFQWLGVICCFGALFGGVVAVVL